MSRTPGKSVKRLKGILGTPPLRLTPAQMDRAIQQAAVKAAAPLENDPRFLRRVREARASLRAGKRVR